MPNTNSVLFLNFEDSIGFAESIKINEVEITNYIDQYKLYIFADNLFGEPIFIHEVTDNSNGQTSSHYETINRYELFNNLVQKELSRLVDARTSTARIRSESRRILDCSILDNQNLEKLANAETLTFRRIYTNMKGTRRSKLRERINTYCQANYLLSIIEEISVDLSQFFRSVEYIGPARARSERFYRQQELEVSEISPDGRNLSMFLASLDGAALKNFSQWVKRIFGYGVSVRRSEGHISVYLQQGGQSVNVVDTGYGVSQVLPVLAQLWWMKFGSGVKGPTSFNDIFSLKSLTIEQPELHLHPAHQALLADVFAETSFGIESDNTMTIQDERRHVSQFVIVETHSESMINRFGELIYAGKLRAKDLQIVVFADESDEQKGVALQVANFDDTGTLQDWPYGFFNY